MKSARPEKKQPQRPTATVAAKGAAKTMPVEPVTPVKRLKTSIEAMAPAMPPTMEKPSACTPDSSAFAVPKNMAPHSAPMPAAMA